MVALIRVKEATRSKKNSKKRRQCKCSSSKRLTKLTAILLKRRPKIVPEKNPESLGVSGAFLELDNLGVCGAGRPASWATFSTKSNPELTTHTNVLASATRLQTRSNLPGNLQRGNLGFSFWVRGNLHGQSARQLIYATNYQCDQICLGTFKGRPRFPL